MQVAKAEEAYEFVRRLADGGTIVSSNDCSEHEIALARACHRFFVDERSFGYVYRPSPAKPQNPAAASSWRAGLCTKGDALENNPSGPLLHFVGSCELPDDSREITLHRGSTLNNAIRILADPRDENGGSHAYGILVSENGIHTRRAFAVPRFQKGPLKEAGNNGISDEALIAIVIDRLEGFQTGPYRSRYNALAITKLEEALHWLQARTRDRQDRGVEGTHRL